MRVYQISQCSKALYSLKLLDSCSPVPLSAPLPIYGEPALFIQTNATKLTQVTTYLTIIHKEDGYLS